MLAHAVLSPMLSSTDAGTPPMFGIPGGGVAVSGYPSPLINGAPNGMTCHVIRKLFQQVFIGILLYLYRNDIKILVLFIIYCIYLFASFLLSVIVLIVPSPP